MFRILTFLLAISTVTYGRMAYQFSDGVDYILSDPIEEAFSCEDLPYGYYADTANNCEIFHICMPIADDIGALVDTFHYSFACGEQTVFSQDTLTCQHKIDAFPCDQSRSLYELANSEFGVIRVDDKKK